MIPIPTQRKGVKRAADDKFLGIQERLGGPARALTRLIEGLGLLTHAIQVHPSELEGVKTEERGIFYIDEKEEQLSLLAEQPLAALRHLFDIAARENLIIYRNPPASTPQSGSIVREFEFRLHRRFAPRFGFSYRGALERWPLHRSDLLQLISEDDQSLATAEWASKICQKGLLWLQGANGNEQSRYQGDLFQNKGG